MDELNGLEHSSNNILRFLHLHHYSLMVLMAGSVGSNIEGEEGDSKVEIRHS